MKKEYKQSLYLNRLKIDFDMDSQQSQQSSEKPKHNIKDSERSKNIKYEFFRGFYSGEDQVRSGASKVNSGKIDYIEPEHRSSELLSNFFKLSEVAHKMSKVDRIFVSAAFYLNNFEQMFNLFDFTGKKYMHYIHEKIEYVGTVFLIEHLNKFGKLIKNLNIKLVAPQRSNLSNEVGLSNDGFVYYPSKDKIHIVEEGIQRYNSNTWASLDEKYISEFSSIINWCKIRLGCSGQGGRAKVKLFYNFKEERIDIKIFGVEKWYDKMITITFEPGYPEFDFDDERFAGYDV